MNTRYLSSKVTVLTLVLMNASVGVPPAWAAAQALDTAKIEQLTGVQGRLNEKEGVVMGDMVLLEDQVNPVMSVALDQGLEVSASWPSIAT